MITMVNPKQFYAFSQLPVTALLVIALLQVGSALPVSKQLLGEANFLPDDNVIVDETERKGESSFKGDVLTRKRSASELENELEDQLETAGDYIYNTFENLPPELQDWLFEMDIVKSDIVEEVLETGDDKPDATRDEERRSRTRKAAGVNEEHHYSYLWPEGRVPYTFHPFISDEGREAAMKGIDHWMSHTCLRFEPREETDTDYIQFVERHGCWSYVGKNGGAQLVSLGPTPDSYCKYTGVVVHELGHVIGLWHEQSRPDRDNYIEIEWDNILSGSYRSFKKYSWTRVNNLSLPYDYASIMHYPPYAFSRNGKQTIIPLKPGVRLMGQRKSLSPLDIKFANLLYDCQITATNNSEELPADTLKSNYIPEDAFLIQNYQTQTCLEVSNRTTVSTVPVFDQHLNAGLYYVSLTDCRLNCRAQHWQWTSNNSLLHLGTFLCLTALSSEHTNSRGRVTDVLVLMHCRGDDVRQKWACAGDFIENANIGKCITASAVQNRGKRGAESAKKRHVDNLTEELRHFISDPHPLLPTFERKNQTFNNSTGLANSTDLVNTISNVTFAATLEFCEEAVTRQVWCSIDPTNLSQTENHVSKPVARSICSSNTTESNNLPLCYVKDMSEAATLPFYSPKWIACDKLGYYAAGFYHTDQVSGNEASGVLTGIDCCASSSVFTGQPDSSPATHEEDCVEHEWWNWQDTLISKGWFSCPRGMFLKGFLMSTRPFAFGHYIWNVKCCKPQSSPVVYEHCYTDYGQSVASDTGVHRCSLEGYHVTGMYKKDCSDEDNCAEELTCCMSLSV